MRFEFATAGRVIFGPATLPEVSPSAHALGGHAFVILESVERSTGLLELIRAAGLEATPHPIAGEPAIPSILEAVGIARSSGCDLVIGMGGGSALDTSKAVAALLTNPGDIRDYLEVVGHGKALTKPPVGMIAIPTTAGTGAEVTRNAVIFVPEQHVKVSLRSPYLLPRLAIVDPELTYSLPPDLTASTGLDAVTQLIEPFVSNASNPLTDALCREGLRRAARSLLRACDEPRNLAAREDMAIASLFSGMALANARLGAVHGLAGVIGGMFPAPHGAVCARLLPIVMEANLRALKARARSSPVIERYAEIAQILTGNGLAKVEDGARWVYRLARTVKIQPLSDYGLSAADLPGVVDKARISSSLKGNPIELTEAELTDILEAAS